MLTYHERKSRLPHGAVSAAAARCGVAPSTVTHVLRGVHRNRAIEKALAAVMAPRTTVTDAFGARGPERMARPTPVRVEVG